MTPEVRVPRLQKYYRQNRHTRSLRQQGPDPIRIRHQRGYEKEKKQNEVLSTGIFS